MIYKFNNIEIDTENYQLLSDGEKQSVEPQVFNLIVFLIQNKDKVMTREQILEHVWKGRIVSDSSISNHIKSARKVLGDNGIKQQVIKTIHSRGYQFIATCESSSDSISVSISEPGSINKYLFLSSRNLIALGILIFISIGFWLTHDKFKTINSSQKLVHSIAVLAFKDLSPNSDQNYFAEGISEELLNLFTRIPDLRVASRTSSFSYRDKDLTLEEIGKQLNVKYVMEGSVRKSNQKLRITTQLIRVSDGSHIWSETYDHEIQDVFEIQDKIAQSVSDKLKISLSNETASKIPTNPDAHITYLKALYYFRQNTKVDLIQALELINQAIELDADNAQAWTLKSRIHYKMLLSPFNNNNIESKKLAKESILNARLIDNKEATTNAQMALIHLLDFDFDAARFNMDLAMNTKNKNTATIEIMAYYFQLVGQLDKSVEILEKGIEQDPINDTFYYDLAIGYYFQNQLKESTSMMSKYYYFHKDAHIFKGIVTLIYLQENKVEAALEIAKEEPNEFFQLLALGFANYAIGDKQQADSILNQLISEYSKSYSYIASLYAYRKDFDNAFKWLDFALENQDTELLYVINFHVFRNLLDDPRWSVFVNKINLSKEHWLIEPLKKGAKAKLG